jgi:tryptophanyl-tRNA synthetase
MSITSHCSFARFSKKILLIVVIIVAMMSQSYCLRQLSTQLKRGVAVQNFRSYRMCASDSEPVKEEGPPRVKRVLSGVQPTGTLHLGNYLGAIRQWVANQDLYDNYFCVVDLHAITAPHNPKKLRQETLQSAAMYIASGIDPKKSKIFVQSHVKAHAELAWLLNCITPMNWLERMIQYKEKAVKQGENVGVGLFDYPVLMAADILLYQADLVPVGEDQRQHLELTRDIARRFNDQFCKRQRKTFRDPDALILKEGARVMSLIDGTNKMSKSAENDGSRINMLDSPDLIMKKIKRCKSDDFVGLEWGNKDRPEATNLLNIYQAVSGMTKEEINSEVNSMAWSQFKPVLADAVVAHLAPIQQRYKEVMEDEAYLNSVLLEGQLAAELVADQTLLWAKDAMGLLPPIKRS